MHLSLSMVVVLLSACQSFDWEAATGDTPTADWRNLAPVDNPNADAAPQPARLHPYAVAVTADGRTALVTMRGSEAVPRGSVFVIDVPSRRVRDRVTVGDRPVDVSIHPEGRFAVVLSQLSADAAVVDVERAIVTGRVQVGHYAEALAFSADGSRMYVSNRATDELSVWEVQATDRALRATLLASAPAGTNPGAIAIVGDEVYVVDAGGLAVRAHDRTTLEERAIIRIDAPIFDLETMGRWVVASTLNGSFGLPCPDDADYPGREGDGIFEHITDTTCSRGFADIQNEIAFIDPTLHVVAARYTSDTAQASEADREGDHGPETMKVVGALPFGIAVVDGERAYVSMGASFELSEMVVTAEGPTAAPLMEMPRTWGTGFAPRGVATDADGTVAVVANLLGDSVTVIDLRTEASTEIDVGGDLPRFPATSAEIGELYFHSSAYSTDGDQSCTHCHPDADSDGKAWGVGVVRAYGRRATMVVKNLHQTQPLLIEGVFDETDFTLEMEAMSLREDFHDSSYALQVSRRDTYFREVSLRLMNRDLGFDDIAAHLSGFLVIEPRLLPSPHSSSSPEAERGLALFLRPDVACASCHPPPSFASAETFRGITTLGRYDRPRRDLDPDISIKYLETARDGFFNANSMRGMWDRRGALLHDGRARTVRETILTPDHPCLRDGERGFNEFEGRVDTNGGVSHLACDQIDDLIAFIETID